MQRALRNRNSEFQGKNLPCRKVTKHIVTKFEQHGTVTDRRFTVRIPKRHFIAQADVDNVKWICWPLFVHKNGNNININQYTYQKTVKWFMKELKRRKHLLELFLYKMGPHLTLSYQQEHF